MSESHHSPISFKRQRCPRCQVKMVLERASQGPVGFEHRVFECPVCDYAETVVVASDPFKSKAAGWLSGELGRTAMAHPIKDGKLIPTPTK